MNPGEEQQSSYRKVLGADAPRIVLIDDDLSLSAMLICFGLALYVTRPLISLRVTAKRIAAGELYARPPDKLRKRRDEFGELSRDVHRMAVQIEDLLLAQRRFVANVSHELGAPLTRLQLAVTLLQRELGSQGPACLEQIERETERLSRLVQELLYLATLERNDLPGEDFLPVGQEYPSCEGRDVCFCRHCLPECAPCGDTKSGPVWHPVSASLGLQSSDYRAARKELFARSDLHRRGTRQAQGFPCWI